MYSIIGSKKFSVSSSRLLDKNENLLFRFYMLGGSLLYVLYMYVII